MTNQDSYNHAVDLYNAGDYEQAIQIALPFVGGPDPEGQFEHLVGNALLFMDQPEKALGFLETAVELLPTSPFVTGSLYMAYMDLRMCDDAFNEMERYLRVNESIEYDETIIGYSGAVGYRFEVADEEQLLRDVKADIRQGSNIIWPELRRRIVSALSRRRETHD